MSHNFVSWLPTHLLKPNENLSQGLGDSAWWAFFFIHRSIKIRPVSVKTFDEVTMENGTDDSLGVSHTSVVLELNTCFVEFHKALCSAQFDSVSGSCSEWFVPTFFFTS